MTQRKARKTRQWVAKSLQSTHKRAMCEAVRVKPKLQWRHQEVRDARNVKGTSAFSEQSQPKRGHMGCNWQGHRAFRAHIILSCASDSGHGYRI
jgi:hypothetical protein